MTPLVTVEDAVLLSLVLSRVIALFMGFPFFSTNFIPTMVKLFLLLSLSFFLIKNLHLRIDMSHFSLTWYVGLILKELFVGFSLGLLMNIFIVSFSYAAEIITYFMGLTVVNTFDPTYGQVSVLSKMFIMLFYALFFVTGAYHYFLYTLAMSFSYIPLDFVSLHKGIFQFIIEKSLLLFIFAFKLAFPFALILYLINLSLALVNRLIPQINVFIVGLPLQIFIGILALAVGTSVLVYIGIDYLKYLWSSYDTLLRGIGR